MRMCGKKTLNPRFEQILQIEEANSWESFPKRSGLWEEAAQFELISQQRNTKVMIELCRNVLGMANISCEGYNFWN